MNLSKLSITLLFCAIITLSGCVYRMDIEQGNRVSSEKLADLKPGLTKKQVVFLIGEPAIEDLFHANEWFYVYYIKHGDDQSIEQKSMKLTFEGDYLAEITGNIDVPKEEDS